MATGGTRRAVVKWSVEACRKKGRKLAIKGKGRGEPYESMTKVVSRITRAKQRVKKLRVESNWSRV